MYPSLAAMDIRDGPGVLAARVLAASGGTDRGPPRQEADGTLRSPARNPANRTNEPDTAAQSHTPLRLEFNLFTPVLENVEFSTSYRPAVTRLFAAICRAAENERGRMRENDVENPAVRLRASV